MPTILKKTWAVWSMMPSSGLPRSPRPEQREAEQQCDEQHLKDLALGKRADHRGRHDMHDVVDGALLGRLRRVGRDRLGVERVDIDIHAGAGLPQIDDDKADDQGQRGHDLEIDQRLDADPADLLHVLHAGDAVDDGAEDDRGDQHLDQLDEQVTEPFHAFAELRIEIPQQHAENDGAQDLEIEVVIELLVRSWRGGCRAYGGLHGAFPLTEPSYLTARCISRFRAMLRWPAWKLAMPAKCLTQNTHVQGARLGPACSCPEFRTMGANGARFTGRFAARSRHISGTVSA